MSRQPPPDIVECAKASAARWGVPASVSLAQWAIESGWGEHEPAGSNNPFGIKAHGGASAVIAQTSEFVSGAMRQQSAPFAIFPSVSEAFSAHARLLANPEGSYHASAAMLPIGQGDRVALQKYVFALAPVYATDPHYAVNLWGLIVGNQFDLYDNQGVPTS